jgi:plasmid stabilization system protein ParE
MIRQLRFHPHFPRDLQRAINHYELIRESLADDFCRRLDNRLNAIERAPESFSLLRDDIRGCLLEPFPWLVMFEVLGDRVHVLRLVHAASDW